MCCFSFPWEKVNIWARPLLCTTQIPDKSPLLFHYYLKTGRKRWKSDKWKYSGFLQVIVFRNSLTYKTDIFVMVFLIIPQMVKNASFLKYFWRWNAHGAPRSTEDSAGHPVWFEETEDRWEQYGLYLVWCLSLNIPSSLPDVFIRKNVLHSMP